jgi:hypothetical protein
MLARASAVRALRESPGTLSIRGMGRRRPSIAVILGLWTLVCLAAAIVLGGTAMAAIIDADRACFTQTGPCPSGDHPVVIQMTFALVVIPLAWVAGFAAITLAWMAGPNPGKSSQA